MAIKVRGLTFEPDTIRKGTTPVTVSFEAKTGNMASRDVVFLLTVEEEQPVFIITEEGEREKSDRSEKDIEANWTLYEMELEFELTEGSFRLQPCQIVLEATDANGDTSSTEGVLYFK
ncbi:hypothetical protein [Chitinophaga japonensis]|uniref:Uncharacterized protein n=1 Tax=Chitinophaga japonensis TaxID=104662 RepID=A0A562T700_CHIJA|nr:hypothetical protein [Chitinophaga japonensis]TWI89329.1 hypothetical protein LX66_3425 [Chitinophaga japonensis]